MSERAYRITLACAAVFLGLWILFPFWKFTTYPEYQGLVPMRTGDDGAYEDRIQTALLGRYGEVDNGITGTDLHGAGSALVELATGFVLRPFHLHGPEAAVVLMVLIAPLFFVFFSLFLRKIGVSAKMSLALTTIYTLMELGALQRPVNLSFTLPFTALVLLLFAKAKKRDGLAYILPVSLLIGLLPGVYFWAWTFLWAGLGLTLILDREKFRIGVIGVLSFVFSLPILIHTWLMQTSSPYFAETGSYRSGVYPSHGIESYPRSILLLLLAIAAAVIFWRHKEKRQTLVMPVALVFGAFLSMHQNLIHGKDLMFSSHYYPFACLAAVVMTAWVLTYDRRSWPSRVVVLITTIFLVAGFWDYRAVWHLPLAEKIHLSMQHLAPVLKKLDDGNRQMILSDAQSALYVKAWTDDDVVFTPYVQSLLTSDVDYIQRNCLSQLPSPTGPDVHAIAWELTQFRGQHLLPQREAQVREVCTPFLANPKKALADYKVDLLLWNENSRPDWKIDARSFRRIDGGEGWSLWAVL